MTNKNIEDIDNLFREGLNPENDDSTFLENDWSKLKKRLDRNEKMKRRGFWLSRLSGVAALILLFFVLRMLLPDDRERVIKQAEVPQKEHEVTEKKNQSTASSEVKKMAGKTGSAPKSLLAQNKHFGDQSPQNKFNIQSSQKESPNGDSVQVDNISVSQATTEKAASLGEHPVNKSDIVKSTDRKQALAEEPLYETNEVPMDKSEPEHQPRKMALSFLAAPDYNGVNNLNNASLGNDFGLMVTLEIAKNWNFSTGGIYAKKLYETGFNNYTPTKNIWTEYYPKSVNADCRVLDIPLNISYTILKRKNNTISLGSGISSYIMLREDYRFSYAENDSSNPQSYHIVNGSQHWLSVLNLQANFEQRLNQRLSISLQPYMKIPLGNIGFAGVKLQSFGMAANLSWNFNL
jgi:hypothetical protein